ncbi:hypothetical protein D9M69_461630 [compost metagenome]
MAAQLQRYLLHRVGGLSQQDPAHFSGAGEAEGAHFNPLQQLAGQFRRIAGNHLEYASREAGFFGKLRQRQCRQWGFRRRLDDHRATGGQGCTGFTGDHGAGEVPRGDCSGDTNRLQASGELAARQVVGDRFAVAALGFAGEPFQEVCAVVDLTQ